MDKPTECGSTISAAGNGALMRLAPIPLFYYLLQADAVQNAGNSARLTNADKAALDACQFYAFLIWNVVNGKNKNDLLDKKFYRPYFKTNID